MKTSDKLVVAFRHFTPEKNRADLVVGKLFQEAVQEVKKMERVDDLLDKLKKENMCSVVGDELIDEYLRDKATIQERQFLSIMSDEFDCVVGDLETIIEIDSDRVNKVLRCMTKAFKSK